MPIRWNIRLLSLFLLFTTSAHAAASLEVSTFEPVGAKVKELVTLYTPSEVLLALDLDNTLLAMQEPLGSDQWFGWQVELLQTPTHEMAQVANSFASLLAVQKELFEWGAMRPTDPKASWILHELQESGVSMLVLTSRGTVLHDVTERELEKNGFDFSLHGPEPRFEHPWLPGSSKTSLALTAQEVRQFGFDQPRPVSYARGIFLTEGQHKGGALRILLHDLKQDESFKALVFVDDHRKHLDRMHEAFRPALGISLTTFHFVGEKSNVEEFQETGKEKSQRAFEDFQKKKKSLPEESN